MRYLLTLLIIALPIVLALLGLDGWVIAVVGVVACLSAAICVVMTADLHPPAVGQLVAPPPGTPRIRIDKPHRDKGPHFDGERAIIPFRRG